MCVKLLFNSSDRPLDKSVAVAEIGSYVDVSRCHLTISPSLIRGSS